MILLVNQHTVPVFVDVVNAFADTGEETRLFAGHIEFGRTPLGPRVKTIRSTSYNRRTTFTRFGTWMLFSLHYFFYLLFCRKPSHIIVVSNPPTAPFVTALLAGIRGIPFYVVLFDLYPEALQQAGLSSETGWIFRRWQSVNRWTFAKARGLITLSESMKQAASKYASPEKIHIVPNWADINYIQPVDRSSNPFIATHNLHNKFTVMYSGNMGLTHDLESVLDAAHELIDNENICFIMIGEGGKRRKLEAVKAAKGLTNVTFLPYQNASNFPLAMAAADIGIVTLGTGAEGISVPSKTYVNMAAGLAIIAVSPLNSELIRIVEKFAVGYAVAPGQPATIAGHIRFLSSNPEALSQFKSRSREASLNFTPANAKLYVDLVLDK